MAEFAVTSPFRECHLSNQARFYPMYLPVFFHALRRSGNLKSIHCFLEIDEHFCIEASAHFAGRAKTAAIVIPKHQSSESGPGALRIGVADNDKLLFSPTFEFQPISRALRDVGAIGSLRDQPLKTLSTCFPEISFSFALAMLHISDRIIESKMIFQELLAPDQRDGPQVMPI